MGDTTTMSTVPTILTATPASDPSITPSNLPDEPPLRLPETIGAVIEVRTSPKGGLGIFALCTIPTNVLLLSEQPLVILTDTGTRTDPLDELVSALSPSRKSAFLSLHAYQANPRESRNRSILYSNGFGVGKVENLSTGIFETASRFNHACTPSAEYRWEVDVDGVGRMKYFSKRVIEAGEEITVDYGHGVMGLKRFYGFECDCGKCKGVETRGGEGMAEGKDVEILEEVELEGVVQLD
ncbi:uncharacterized protein EAE97_001296 [Botrytis byssoidea]|uniref:SET domain-containing protein n=1 Tax=Botrytis byssoidea TaxID=139641 RepID=A0A9P5IZK4_9HELO|nr:uncharacterized protein EAE97_001296 [Botrytis byssoidea]KAF7953898.1 hypothetical protein EAE97_001296 [Botrytis byssoidea]